MPKLAMNLTHYTILQAFHPPAFVSADQENLLPWNANPTQYVGLEAVISVTKIFWKISTTLSPK